MNVLDFKNLEIKHRKLLNLISIDIQNDMIELMDSLFAQSNNNKFILLHPVFSRSPYQSDLFLTLCYLNSVNINYLDVGSNISKLDDESEISFDAVHFTQKGHDLVMSICLNQIF